MNQLLAIPIEFRLLACFLLGALVASFLNLSIYRLAWNSRGLSPWSRVAPGLAPRGWLDRIPIIGWLRLRREAGFWGAGFWIRPLLIEFCFGLGVAVLYWYEVVTRSMFGASAAANLVAAGPCWAPVNCQLVHGLFLGHFILLALMVSATFIDIDEKTIPDAITIPGTLLGLLLVTCNPWTLPPDVIRKALVGADVYVEFMHFAAPNNWPALMGGRPLVDSLWLALGCIWLWCFALLPRRWYGRCGVRRAITYFFARIARDVLSWIVLAITLVASLAIVFVWFRGGAHWAGLLSSLIGMAFGAGIIWSVRLVGRAILKKEAMGFGDVTLMAMIGSFIGWQAALLVFFLAPLAGLIVGVLQWLLNRDNVVPYGPFLCLGTLLVVIRWPALWDYIGPMFQQMGGLIPLILVFCLALMAVLLALLQVVKALLFRRS